RLDGLEAQLLCKFTTNFESEEKPDVAGDRRWLRSTGHGDPCGDLWRKHGKAALRHRLERRLWLLYTGAVRSGSPSGHGATSITLPAPLHASEVPSRLPRPCRTPSLTPPRRSLPVAGWSRRPAISGRSGSSSRQRRACGAARFAP